MPICFPNWGPLQFPSIKNLGPAVIQPLGIYNTTLTGVSRDASGSPIGGCTIKLYRKSDDAVMDLQTSDGSGNFTFTMAPTSMTFYIRATDSSGLLVGTSLDTLVGA
jgi:hypothetical protein